MGKIINTYQGYTTSDIISRSTAGVSNMTGLDSTQINCTDITLSGAKNAVGHYNSNLGDLCTSTAVNKWSNFGSIEWYYQTNTMNWRYKTPYSLGSFAGYNHQATPPEVISYNNSIWVSENVQTNIGVAVSFDISEVDWYSLGVRKVGVNTKIDGVSQAINYQNLDKSSYDIQNTFNVTLSTNKTLTTELFFADASGVKLSDIPNISAITTSVNVNQAAIIADVQIEEAYQDQLELNISTYSLNQANDTYSISFSNIWDVQQNNTWVGAVALYAALNNDTYIDCNKTVIFGEDVTATGTLPFTVDWNDVVYFKLYIL